MSLPSNLMRSLDMFRLNRDRNMEFRLQSGLGVWKYSSRPTIRCSSWVVVRPCEELPLLKIASVIRSMTRSGVDDGERIMDSGKCKVHFNDRVVSMG